MKASEILAMEASAVGEPLYYQARRYDPVRRVWVRKESPREICMKVAREIAPEGTSEAYIEHMAHQISVAVSKAICVVSERHDRDLYRLTKHFEEKMAGGLRALAKAWGLSNSVRR